MSLELTLQSAISGMQTSKTALQTIANNIANVNTEDYTRKIVDQKSRVLDGQGYGVEIGAISRRVNQGVLKQMRGEMGTLENISVKQDYLSQLNSFFGTPADDNSISHKIGDLGAQFNNLAISPEVSASHFLTVNSAEDTALALRRMSEEVQHLRSSANGKLKETITKVNNLLDEIVDANTSIMTFSAGQLSTAEIEDQRDRSLNSLAEIMDITYFEQSDGSYSVYSGNGQTLVTKQKQALSYVPPAIMNAVLEYTPTSAVNYSGPTNSNYPIGGVPGIFVGEILASTDITTGVKDGLLKGLIDIRDHELRAIQTQLDELAKNLKIEINKAHNKGTGFPPPQVLAGDNFIQGTTDISQATGLVIVSVVDKSGNQLETEYINLADANITNVTTLLTNGGGTGINDKFTTANLVASVTNGNLILAAGNDNRVTINEMTSSMTGAGKIAAGFSDFFGLNNLYQSTENFAAYRSDYKPSSSAAVITTGGTLQFTDATNGARSVTYAANDTLTNLATKISAAAGITATVISDGDGFRLEVIQDGSENLAIVETGAGTFLSETGLRTDYRGISSKLKVRENIVSNNSFISRGTLQSNSFSSAAQASSTTAFNVLVPAVTAGQLDFTIDASTSATIAYGNADTLTTVAASINNNVTLSMNNISAEVITLGANTQLKISNSKSDNFWIVDTGGLTTATSQGISIGDGTVAANIAAEFDAQQTFLAAPANGGGLAQTTSSLTNYAASILSSNSSQVNKLDQDMTFQEQLTMELYNAHTSASGVNMDEELANMIIIEQSYLAAARIITTTRNLFEVLNDMMR
ncbi:MAG TPA: flagellar hook-associated protein FlgK [Rhodospirillales bacterium]|nr:flagellar hook-associated protein FlgK [Rhodospirillales bacterium]HIL75542.1 flagellar hook-associated protein FlgK [Rhodospirillales bacterium]